MTIAPRTPAGLAFGSELKSLKPFPGFDTTIDQHALATFLRASCVVGPQSIYRGAQRLSPSTIATRWPWMSATSMSWRT